MRRAWRWVALVVAVAVAAGLVFLGVVPGVMGRYHNSTPSLAAAYRAKETCSCVFVQGRDEAYCRAWTEASPDVARAVVDPQGKTVRARALLFWTARARWVDRTAGCVLE